jgi:hypothetical protein
MNDLLQGLSAPTDKGWLPALAAGIFVLVRLLKSDDAVRWFPPSLSPEWRPRLALLLGVVASVAKRKADGQAWPQAVLAGLVEGLGAGSAAVAAHELVVEGARKGREIGESRRKFEDRTSAPPAH